MTPYERLRLVLEQRGLSQAWLARRLGCHHSLLSRALRRTTGLERHFPAICRILDLSADWLLFGRDPSPARDRLAEEAAAYEAAPGPRRAVLLLEEADRVEGHDLMAVETRDGRHLIGSGHRDGDRLVVIGPAGTIILPAGAIRRLHRVAGWEGGLDP